MTDAAVRLDKWLWYARFFKTRAAATRMVSSGKLRIDGQVVSKPHRQVQTGHVYTFAQGPQIRVIRVVALGSRRGPAPEAALLYEDLAPPEPKSSTKNDSPDQTAFQLRETGSGRPTKRDRRLTTKLKDPFA